MIDVTKIINTTLALIYFAILSLVYNDYISEIYNYTGFKNEFVFNKLLLSIVSIILFYLSIGSRHFKCIYFHVMLAFTFIPSLVLFSCGGQTYDFFIYSVLCCSAVVISASIFNPKIVTIFKINESQFLGILLGLTVVYIVVIILNGGLKYWNLNISAVYDFRRESAANLPGIFGYLSPLMGKVIIPMLICISILKKKWSFTIIGIIFSIVLFGLTAHKAPLFFPVVIMAMYYMAQFNLPKMLLFALILVCIVSYFDFSNGSSVDGGFYGWFGDLAARRALMVPVLLNANYIDYFTSSGNYFWANSKFTFGLIEPPFSISAPYQIGKIYFGNEEMSADTGWIGSGFGNAGLVGALIYSILIGYVIALFSNISKKIGRNFTISTTIVVMLVIFTSTDFTTSLLTHGLLFLIFFLIIIPEKMSR
jgi:hypothetical protein